MRQPEKPGFSARTLPPLEIPGNLRRPIERPDRVVSLQDVIARIIEARFGFAANAEWTPATLRGELDALPVGGLRTAWCEWARDWLLGELRAGRLRLLLTPLGGGYEAEETHPDYWRATDHDAVVVQRLILARSKDRTGTWQFEIDETAFEAAAEGLNELYREPAAPTESPPPQDGVADDAITSNKKREFISWEEEQRRQYGSYAPALPSNKECRPSWRGWAKDNAVPRAIVQQWVKEGGFARVVGAPTKNLPDQNNLPDKMAK